MAKHTCGNTTLPVVGHTGYKQTTTAHRKKMHSECDKPCMNSHNRKYVPHNEEMYRENFNNNNRDFKIHIISKGGEKRYECLSCSKIFKYNSNLKSHLRIHDSAKIYICRVCGNKFTGRNNFVRHMRLHTMTKKYQCYICASQFTMIYHLKSHMKMHNVKKKSSLTKGKDCGIQSCYSIQPENDYAVRNCNEKTILYTEEVSHSEEIKNITPTNTVSMVAPTDKPLSAFKVDFNCLSSPGVNDKSVTTATTNATTSANTHATTTDNNIQTPLPSCKQYDVHNEIAEIKQNLCSLHSMVEEIMKHFNIGQVTTPSIPSTQSPTHASELPVPSNTFVHQKHPGKPSHQFAQSEHFVSLSDSTPHYSSVQVYESGHTASLSNLSGPVPSSAYESHETQLCNQSHSPTLKTEENSSSNLPDILFPSNTCASDTSIHSTVHHTAGDFHMTTASSSKSPPMVIYHGSPSQYYPVSQVVKSHNDQWMSPSPHCPQVPADISILNHTEYRQLYETCNSRKDLAQKLLPIIFTQKELQENSFKGIHTRLGKFNPYKVKFMRSVVFTKFPARNPVEVEELWTSLVKKLSEYLRHRRFQNKGSKDVLETATMVVDHVVEQKAESVITL